MKFTQFREYRDTDSSGLDKTKSIVDYLVVDMPRWLKDLALGLTKLSFNDNFESFTVSVTINAGQELAIRNGLRTGNIPNQRIIVRGGPGSESVVDGLQSWNSDFVYLKNVGLSAVTVTVVFLRA